MTKEKLRMMEQKEQVMEDKIQWIRSYIGKKGKIPRGIKAAFKLSVTKKDSVNILCSLTELNEHDDLKEFLPEPNPLFIDYTPGEPIRKVTGGFGAIFPYETHIKDEDVLFSAQGNVQFIASLFFGMLDNEDEIGKLCGYEVEKLSILLIWA